MTAAIAYCGSYSSFIVTVNGTLGQRQYYFCGILLKSCLLRGRKAMMRYWDAIRQFAASRATNLCLQESHVHWRSGTGTDDGTGFLVAITIYN